MARRSPDELVVRVVLVPGGAGAADARRRVLEVLLAAARPASGDGAEATTPPKAAEVPANGAPSAPDPAARAA